MSLARTVARNSLWTGLDKLVDTILPPIMSIIVARILGPTKLGAFSYVMWFAVVAASLAGAGAAAAGRKFLPDCIGQRSPETFLATIRALAFGEIVLLVLSTAIGLAWVHIWLPADDRSFASLAMLSIIPVGLMWMASAVNTSVQELRPNVIASIIAGLVHTLGLVIALLLGAGLLSLAAVHLASRIVDFLLRWYLTLKRLPAYLESMGGSPTLSLRSGTLAPGMSRAMAWFTAENTVLMLLTLVVWNRSEMVFLKWYSTVEQIAYFSVAFSLSVIPGQLVAPFSLAAMTSVYAERGRDAKAGVRVSQVYWRYLVLLVLPASLGLAVLSGPLLRVLYGPRYFDAVPVLMIAGALSMFATLGQPATTLVTASGGQRRLVVVGILSAMATLLLDFFLVRAFAATGGALANGLGQAISTVTVILVARRFGFSTSFGLVLRVMAAALGMTAAVGVLVYFAPDLAGIVAGPVVGALAYMLLLRVLKIVDQEDVSRFTSALRILPGRLRSPFQKMLHFLAPTGK